MIKLSRPRKPRIKKCDLIYETFLSNYKNMNGVWLNDVKYQMIMIEFKMNERENEWVEYNNNKEWISSIRIIEEGEPICIKV